LGLGLGRVRIRIRVRVRAHVFAQLARDRLDVGARLAVCSAVEEVAHEHAARRQRLAAIAQEDGRQQVGRRLPLAVEGIEEDLVRVRVRVRARVRVRVGVKASRKTAATLAPRSVRT